MKTGKLLSGAVAALLLAGCDASTHCADGIEALQARLSRVASGPVIERISESTLAAQSLVRQAQLSRTTRDYEVCSAKVDSARRHLRAYWVF